MNLSHGLFCYFTIEILYYFMIFRLDKKKLYNKILYINIVSWFALILSEKVLTCLYSGTGLRSWHL